MGETEVLHTSSKSVESLRKHIILRRKKIKVWEIGCIMELKESGKILELDENSKESKKKKKGGEDLRYYKESDPNFLSNY